MTDLAGAPMRAPAPDQAYCVVHPSSPATGTCSRCGSYVCAQCTVGADGMCAPCRERLGIDQFPFSREAWEVGGLVSHAWDVFKRNVGAMVVVSIAVLAVPYVIVFVSTLFAQFTKDSSVAGMLAIAGQLVQQIATIVLSLGAAGVFLDAVRGRPLTFDSFVGGAKRVGAGLLQYLLIFLVAAAVIGIPVAIGVAARLNVAWLAALLLLIIPMVYEGLGLMFMQLELVNDPSCGAIEAMSRSWEIARGKRLDIFGAGFVAGVIIIAGVFLCGFGLLASYPLGMLVIVGMYLALRNGADVPDVASRS